MGNAARPTEQHTLKASVMKSKRSFHLLIAALVVAFVGLAHANGSPPPSTPENPLKLQLQGTLTFTPKLTNQQGQAQGQSMGQGQEQSATSTSGAVAGSSSSSGAQANGTNTLSNSNGASSDQQTYVDAADRSSSSYVDNSRFTVIPAMVPPTPPSVVGIGNIVKETLACGPLQAVERVEVFGVFHGIFSKDTTPQGWTERLIPYVKDEKQVYYHHVDDPLVKGDKIIMGHQPVLTWAMAGIAGARNLAVGGGNSSGSHGQAGGGTSSSNTQMITNIQLRECEVGRLMRKPEPPVAPPPTVVTTPFVPPVATPACPVPQKPAQRRVVKPKAPVLTCPVPLVPKK